MENSVDWLSKGPYGKEETSCGLTSVNSKPNAKKGNNQRKNCPQVLTCGIISRLPYAINWPRVGFILNWGAPEQCRGGLAEALAAGVVIDRAKDRKAYPSCLQTQVIPFRNCTLVSIFPCVYAQPLLSTVMAMEGPGEGTSLEVKSAPGDSLTVKVACPE